MQKELLEAVRKEYGLIIHKSQVIHDRPKSLVVRLHTDRGQYILKKVFFSIKDETLANL